MRKKEGVCWFPIDAMVTQGCAALSSLETIRERSLTIGGGGGGGGGLVNFGGGLRFFGLPFRKG